VIGPGGDPLEIQIRTREMHRTSEYGIAAHWRYKEGGRGDDLDQKLSWLRSLLEWQEDMRDSREFMEHLKLNLFDNQVFVFTPKGDVMGLTVEATPLDFAYHVHTSVGHHCVGAKVNGKIVPLDYTLHTGDICEVMVNKNSAGPSLDWISICKTSSAKHKIKQWFRKNRREENITSGRDAFEREVSRQQLGSIATAPFMTALATRLNHTSVDDLMAAIGFGDISLQSIIAKLREEARKQNVISIDGRLKSAVLPARRPSVRRAASGISVLGAGDVLVRFAKCCMPVPGDPILGFISQGKGVSVHRVDCPNVGHIMSQPERLIDVAWDAAPPGGRRSGGARSPGTLARHHGGVIGAEDERHVGHRAREARSHRHDFVQPRDPRSRPFEPHPRKGLEGSRRPQRLSRHEAGSARRLVARG
jgi:GTP pyrophosphokinase